jgi:hypothetical protein
MLGLRTARRKTTVTEVTLGIWRGSNVVRARRPLGIRAWRALKEKGFWVTGATGNVGGGVIRSLGQAREVELIAGVRSPGNAEPGVTQVYFDFNDPDRWRGRWSGLIAF